MLTMKNYYEYDKKLNIDDVGFNGKSNVADVMGIFQQAVTLHTIEMGVDFETIHKNHNAKWFIVSARIEIDEYPALSDNITVRTWPLKASPVRFPRSIVMEKEGVCIAKAMTHWCIVDYDTDTLLKSSTIGFPFDEFLTDDPTTQKCRIPNLPEGEFCYSRKMMLSDIDLNRHVNNVSYIRIAMDCFSTKEMENMDISSLDIQYRAQCFEGDTLSLYKLRTETGYIIDGKRENDAIFRAQITLK